MENRQTHPVVATAGVALTIVLYTVLNKYLTPVVAGIPELAFAIGLFASVGFYVAFYKISVWTYFRYIHERVNPLEAITGDWVYELAIRGKEDKPRYGICQIRRYADCLTASGLHYNPSQNKFTSRFDSEAVLLVNQQLTIIYNSAGVDEDIFSRKGVYSLSTAGIRPQRIYGVWTDILPSRNAGDISMVRRDARSEAMLREVGYPLDAQDVREVLERSPRLVDRLLKRSSRMQGPSRQLFFVRHAESEKNVEDRHGHSSENWSLTSKGRTDAEAFAGIFRAIVRSAVIVSSNESACIETADLLASTIDQPYFINNDLRSIYFGVVSGKSRSEIKDQFPEIDAQFEAYHRGELHPKDYDIPEAETNQAFEARVRKALLSILKVTSGSVVVVCHRSTITMAANIVSNLPKTTEEGTYQLIQLPHLSVSLIDVSPYLLKGKVVGLGLKIDDHRLRQMARRS